MCLFCALSVQHQDNCSSDANFFIHMSAKKQKRFHRLCHCDWPECETIRANICRELPITHPWRHNIIRIPFKQNDPSKMSIAAFAVFRSIRHHLMKDNTTDIDVPKNIYLYPHHYPLALLSYLYDAGKERISFTRPL